MLQLDRISLVQDDFALNADWQVDRGETVAVVGPSGAGKSTLLSAIAGFLAPAHGRTLWEGQDITALPPGRRPVSILFQDQNLFPHLTVTQNLGLGVRSDLRLTEQDQTRVTAVLARVGLAGLEERRPGQLSGGQAGRAALARALLQARPVLLLDEPFAALGPGLRTEMLDLVREVTTEASTTVLMVTHDPADAARVAGRVVFVDAGEARAPIPTQTFLTSTDPAIRAYLGQRRA